MDPELLTVTAAAEMLGIGRTKMYELVARKLVPVVRIDRSVRIPRRALAQWVDSAAAGDPITATQPRQRRRPEGPRS